ncbi:MAG: glycosyltransferase family 2 protein [Cyanobacteria bacterium SID2]|nr:glycosyltransferase family 2 protein [Cyanobacteria bacterium SID2]MBP0005385.1 glycosyltransferase family 2 protein [Cyanobacteria bacterium SBC]
MFLSVVVPTYNRLPILQKCLHALETQQFPNDSFVQGYEVVVVDDGSTDGTWEWLLEYARDVDYLRSFRQENQGPAAARNLGVERSIGDTIVFIDSDLVVTATFLQSHADRLAKARQRLGHDRIFTYGAVINTCNFDDPTREPYKLTDFSAAYFATGNVAISRQLLDRAGPFDTQFRQYGWEDLELGVRLKALGVRLIKCPEAAGYHWNPSFRLERLPTLIDREIQRARTGVLFYQKHPTWEVRLMIQMTWLHRVLWGVLSLGGRLNERTMAPLLQWLIDRGKSQLALEVARIFLNWYNVQAIYRAYAESGQSNPPFKVK